MTKPKLCKKVKYSSEQFALSDIERIRKRSGRSKIPTNTYFCVPCGSWHLTSQKNKRIEKIKNLENQIKSLIRENELLKLENNDLKLKTAKNNNQEKQTTEERMAIRIDSRVIELNNQLNKLKKIFKRQRTDVHMLIMKNLKLQNEININKEL